MLSRSISCGHVALVLACAMAFASPALAQGITPRPPGPFVIDLRGATSGLPTDVRFFPPADDDSDADAGEAQTLNVPARGFGFEVGGHAYLVKVGPARLGLGVSFAQLRGTSVTAIEEDGSTGTGDDTTTPVDVVVKVRLLSPQVSLNFGTADGWSYLSAGYGRATITSRVGGGPDLETSGLTDLNFGGGARWFFSDHLGIGFDVRWHRIGAGDVTPRATMFGGAVGLSIR